MSDDRGLVNAVIEAARRVRRGCDCEYDHRCSRCSDVIRLHEAVAALDEHAVSELMRLNRTTPTTIIKLLPRKAT